MPRKKEEWITGKEAAALLTERSGHEINQNYVRFLAYKANKIAHRPRDGRTEEYLKSDVEGIQVRKHIVRPVIAPRLSLKQKPWQASEDTKGNTS